MMGVAVVRCMRRSSVGVRPAVVVLLLVSLFGVRFLLGVFVEVYNRVTLVRSLG